jgi:hypothetical protein
MGVTRSMAEIKFRRFLFTLSGAISITTAFVLSSGIAFGWHLSLSWSLRIVVGAVIIATLYYEMRQAQLREERAAAEAAGDEAGLRFLEPATDASDAEQPLTDEDIRAFLSDPNTQDALVQYTKRLRESNQGVQFATQAPADLMTTE